MSDAIQLLIQEHKASQVRKAEAFSDWVAYGFFEGGFLTDEAKALARKMEAVGQEEIVLRRAVTRARRARQKRLAQADCQEVQPNMRSNLQAHEGGA